MIPIPEQLKESETPFFLIDENRIRENLSSLASLLPPGTRLFYSVKTNYELPVLETLVRAGIGAEVSSGFELTLAFRAGFPPADIILDGPAWREPELESAVLAGIHMFNLDSLPMASLLDSVASRRGQVSPASIRIRTASFPRFGVLTSLGRKFGIPARAAAEFAGRISGMKGIELKGLSTHTGTALSHPRPLLRAVESGFRTADILRGQGFAVSSLNFGGGLPAPGTRAYTSLDHALIQLGFSPRASRPDSPDFSRFCDPVTRAIERRLAAMSLREFEIAFEPGRSIISNAGVLVTRVLSVKGEWIFVDGGVNLLPEAPFFLGRGFYLERKRGEKPRGDFHISGPSLNTADVLGLGVPLPPPEPGDVLVAENAGAYSISRSNQFTRLRPAVYFVSADGSVKTCRDAESTDDFLRRWPV